MICRRCGTQSEKERCPYCGTELLVQTHGVEGVEELGASIPLGLGKIEDVGAAAVFLASDEACYVTGATLDVNGGANFR